MICKNCKKEFKYPENKIHELHCKKIDTLFVSHIKIFGIVEGIKTYLFLKRIRFQNWFDLKILRKKWCSNKGFMCKDKNCKFKHYDKPRSYCTSKLNLDDNNHFMYCEKYKGHRGEHEALGTKWERVTK